MKRTITSITAGLFLFLSGLQAQTTCPDDRVAYVNSKNVGITDVYTLSIGAEEKAGQTYHYSGPGKVSGVQVFGYAPSGASWVVARLYNVDINDRPTGVALKSSLPFHVTSPVLTSYTASFSPAVSVNSNFAVVVEILNIPFAGHDFALKYTGNGDGLLEDLASLAGSSTGGNWASALTSFSKDGDFYINPRMVNFNTPMFTVPSTCFSTGASVAFTNTTQMTTDPMFNKISAPGYAGSNFLYTWNFGDLSPVSHATNPSHTYAAGGVYTITLTSVIEGWDGLCTKTYTKTISVGLAVSSSALTNVTCNGANNGSVTAVGAGGATPYTYSLNGGIYQSSATFSGLPAGTHSLTVKDNLGCTQSTSFTITQPAAITFPVASSTNASCGNADGGILVTSAGGFGTMQYKLNGSVYQATGAFSGLAANAYTVTARDANSCTNSIMVLVNDLGGPSFGVTNHTHVSCFGGNDGSIMLTSLGGTGTMQYSVNGGTTFQTSGSFPSLTAGTYIEVVKDAAGCTDIKTVTINQPQQLTFTASSVPVSCFGGTNGQINVANTTGGTGSVVYSLNGISFQSGTNFPGLSAGTYTVYARDIAACVKTVSVVVAQPTALTAAVTITNAACYNAEDAIINIVASGGTAGYLYGINGDSEYQSSGSFGNLTAGTYSLIVTDANGCTYNTSATITQPTVIVPVATTTNSTCGNSNGGMLVTATGGSGAGYTYSLNGGAFGVGTFSSLAAGTYLVTAKDGTGCLSSKNVVINNSDGPVINTGTTLHTNVNCNNGQDGSITVGSVTGGTGALTYSVNGITYQSSNVFIGLPAGTYNVTVKDAVGCIGNTSVTLTQPSAFTITTAVVNELCYGSTSGSVTMSVGGGAGVLAYSINGGSVYQSANTFTGLSAGTYTLIVKDAGGCLGSATATISQPNVISAFYSTLNVTCHGANNGTLNVFAWGGTGSLQYSLNGTTYQTSNVFTGLAGGVYNIFVKDANNCVVTIGAWVYEPSVLTISASISPVTCAGGDDGVIDLSVSGGTFDYFFDWSNNVDSEDNFNLTAGTYTVVVSDENGCAVTMSYIVTEPAFPVVVNGTVVNSTGTNNGSVDVTVNGGVGSYTYLWSNGAITEDVTGLLPGVYSVVVTDGNGCAASSTFVVTSTSGIATADVIAAQVTIFPNPANDYVVIEINGFRIDRVEVYDILGQMVYTGEPKNSKVEINTTSLNQGVYLVKILVDEKLITKKMRVIK